MIVVVANDLPPAVRGKMKLWFVEPKPNVFVSGIKDTLGKQVADMLIEYCPDESGLLIFMATSEPPFYRILAKGMPSRNLMSISGLQLIIEKIIIPEA